MSLQNAERASPRLVSKKHEGSPSRLLFITACAYLGPLSFGYTIGYSSPAIPKLINDNFLTSYESGWFGSLITVGAIFGGPFAGWCIEKAGRKATIGFSSIPFVIGWLCIAFAQNSSSLFAGRFFCGFASGMVTVCGPVYVAEIATNSLRGMLGSGVQLSITVGILIAYILGIFASWSEMAYFGLVVAIFTILSMMIIPETPRWLLMKGRKVEAVQALARIRGLHADVEEECRDIEEGLDVQETFAWSDFRKPELSRPLMISVMIMVFQQFSGINAVMFYTVSIFQGAGIHNAEVATVSIGAVQVVATFVACLLMDRTGRRKLLIIAGSLMSLSCFMFGLYYQRKLHGSLDSSMGAIAVVCLVFYTIGFSLGWGPVPMLIMSEIFPSRVRGAASGIAVFTNWFCAFVVTKEFLFINEAVGEHFTFWIFGIICLSAVLYVWKKVPETKGKSLEDIELFFLGKSIMNA